MNPQLTEIAYILDRSGSMQSMQEAAVAGFNQFLKSQLDVPGDANLTLVLFDDEYLVPSNAQPVEDVPELNAATYTPRGSTALLDAIGRTIKDTEARLSRLPEDAKPGKVIIAIFTDGEENASQHYSAKHIADLIRLYRAEKKWEFIFLAANQDAIATAAGMCVNEVNTSNVTFSKSGMTGASKALSRKVTSLRREASGHLDEATAADFARPMSKLVQEETEAEEGK